MLRSGGRSCDLFHNEISDVREYIWWEVYSWIYEILIKFLPTLLIIVLNILVLRKLCKIWANRQRIINSDPTNPSDENISGVYTISLLVISPPVLATDFKMLQELSRVRRRVLSRKIKKKKKQIIPFIGSAPSLREKKLTMLLLYIVVGYFILTTPSKISYIFWLLAPQGN
ncbi:uncharacterized protein LOC111714202 [Eurytemora carolleeae]|uniref:uncharacterized protein LOC111714202 n=1 Tax=Eurytemora carolleeae TaxID=1294199 RepID=UPI000C75EE20|nr:uncharacterized protein LOC111714202 [Eurytemora carolleeae]|eukprot:XP_023345024.1 uncharacterized protein LOC111714202 [Eurytemora affinis]